MIGWLVARGLSERLAKVLSVAVPILLLGMFLWWLRADAYSDGENAERARWEARIEKAKAEQRERERKAYANLQQRKTADDAAAAQRTKEIDNATATFRIRLLALGRRREPA